MGQGSHLKTEYPRDGESGQVTRLEWIAAIPLLAIITLLGFDLITTNLDYAFGHHPDAPKKIGFLTNNDQDFFHPVLMLQFVRLANLFASFSDPQDIMLLARQVMAGFGTAFIIAVFFLALHFVRPLVAVGCSALAGFAPMTIVHAHYVKEDMIFTFFVTVSLAALCSLVDRPDRKRAIVFGVLAGLAASSKYVGSLLFVLAVAALVLSNGRENTKAILYAAVTTIGIGVLTFLLVNYPLITEFETFRGGITTETNHALDGHVVKNWPNDSLWTFHLRNSLNPGMTPWALAGAIAAMGWLLVSWRRQRANAKILLIATVSYYLLIESLPLKPFPGFARYAQPLIAPMVILLAIGLTQFIKRIDRNRTAGELKISASVMTVLMVLSIPAFQASQNYARAFEQGTRAFARATLEQLDGLFASEQYSLTCQNAKCRSVAEMTGPPHHSVRFLGERPEVIADADYGAVSSFQYERFFLSETLTDHPEGHKRIADTYRQLLCLPRLTIQGDLTRFAFFEPIVHIIDLRGDGSMLEALPPLAPNDRISMTFERGCNDPVID